MKILKNEGISTLLIVVGLVILLLGIIFFFWNDFNVSTDDKIQADKWGQFGDFIGGLVGTIWALAGVMLFYLALKDQRADIKTNQETLQLQVTALNRQIEEFELQREEMESSRKVHEQQFKTSRLQQFDSHFYSLLNVYLDIKKSLNQSEKTGDFFRSSFDQMLIPFDETIDLYQYYDDLNMSYLEVFYEKRSQFSHYFKCFYRIIKMIDENAFLSREEKSDYTKILRSQITDFEQLIIHFNSLSIYGIKSRKYLLGYNILKHLPRFEKPNFRCFSELQGGHDLLHFSDSFLGFVISTIVNSMDIDEERPDRSIADTIFNGVMGLKFLDNEVFINVIFSKPLNDNGINLTEDQFLLFLYHLLIDRLQFSQYLENKELMLEKSKTISDEEIDFSIKISYLEGVSFNFGDNI